VLAQSSDRRSTETYADAENILREVTTLHSHLQEQDRILNHGIALVESAPSPRIRERAVIKPGTVAEQYVGINGRIAAVITRAVSTMWAFYLAAILLLGWIALAYVGIIKFDADPFACLLFLSTLLQLVFMFVLVEAFRKRQLM
jgi:hypothetical protein